MLNPFLHLLSSGKNIFIYTLLLCTFCLVLAFGVASVTYAQSSAPWYMHSYIWNERLNIWARTLCSMPIGAVSSAAGSIINSCACSVGTPFTTSCSESVCDGTTTCKHGVTYYHDGGVGIRSGEIRGKAWSPTYGVISFDLSDFPADDATTTSVNESSCYGLTGTARQARVVRVVLGANNAIDKDDSILAPGGPTTGTSVAVVGCAYVPLLKDFILLSPVGSNKNLRVNSQRKFSSTGTLWSGVYTHTVAAGSTPLGGFGVGSQHQTDIDSSHIQMFGCGWSQKSGAWSFGANINRAGVVDCLPGGAGKQNEQLKTVTDNTALGVSGGVTRASVRPLSTTARIGQQIGYSAECPVGHSRALTLQIYEDVEDIDLLFGLNSSPTIQQITNAIDRTKTDSTTTIVGSRTLHRYAEVIFSPIAALRVVCVDGHDHTIFSGNKVGSGRGVNVESLVFHNFQSSPAVITEGGIVDFDVQVTNFGNPNSNGGYCTVTDVRSNRQVLCFETKGFATTQSRTVCGGSSPTGTCLGDSSDTVVRDTSYELRCYHDTSNRADAYQDTNFCQTVIDRSADTDARWRSVGPFKSYVKVLPNRLLDRHISSSVAVPTIRKLRSSGVLYIEFGVTSAAYGYELRVHELDSSNPLVRPFQPSRIIMFFGSAAAADARTNNACVVGSRLPGETHTQCLARVLFGTTTNRTVVVGSLTHRVLYSALSGKKIIAELYTSDGRRSEKVAFDPDYVPPQSALRAETGNRAITLRWDSLNDPSITTYMYRSKKGDGSYRPWSIMTNTSSVTTSHRVTKESGSGGASLLNGFSYTFQIRALRGSARGVPSNEATATPLSSRCGGVTLTDSNANLVRACDLLLVIRDTLRGTSALNWSSSRTIQGWTGVTMAGGVITAVRLNNKNLNGTIPPEIGLLNTVQTLDLSGNRLRGSIPEELGSMTGLINLYLQSNQLTGQIPSELSQLSRLTRFWAHTNFLSGSIPSGLGTISGLISFRVNSNNLTGCIPTTLNRPVSTVAGSQWQVNTQRNTVTLPVCS